MQPTRKKNFCILVALPEEFNTVVAEFEKFLQPAASGASERFGAVPRQDAGLDGKLVIRQCKAMANTWSAAATAAIIADYEPDVLLFVGIAASMQPRHVRLGDVVIADGLRSRTFGKICDASVVADDPAFATYDNHFALRAFSPDLPDISPRTRQLVNASAKSLDVEFTSPVMEQSILDGVKGAAKSADRPCKVHCEQIFSWDLVLDSDKYRDALVKSESKSYALDMESLGFYSVVEECRNAGHLAVDAVVFRGISDYAAFKAPSGTVSTDWRKIASKNAARAALKFLQTSNFGSVGSTKLK